MELYFLRHGIAVNKSDSDSERSLTPQGIKQMRQVAKGMKRSGLLFDKILSSPYVRARQTAEIIAQDLRFKGKIRFIDALVPGSDFKDFFKLLEEFEAEERILFVGHQPLLGEFISQLVAGHKKVAIDLKKAGLCRVDTSELGLVGEPAELVWLLTPEQISGR